MATDDVTAPGIRTAPAGTCDPPGDGPGCMCAADPLYFAHGLERARCPRETWLEGEVARRFGIAAELRIARQERDSALDDLATFNGSEIARVLALTAALRELLDATDALNSGGDELALYRRQNAAMAHAREVLGA